MRSFLCASAIAITCNALFVAPRFLEDVAYAQGIPKMFAKGPYLQELTPTAVTIRFELPTKNAASVEVTHEGDAPIVVTDASESTFHSLRIEKLKPSTRYTYVVNVRGALSSKGEIVTAPPDGSNDPFTFLIYGDNRTNHDAHATVVNAMRQSPGDFLIHTGDFVQSGSSTNDWQMFFEVESPYLRDRCLFSCVGNHELYEDASGAAYMRYFGPSPSVGTHLYNSVRWGNARFFFLNAFEDWNSGDSRAWLDDALKRADTEPGLVWRFAVAHQGAWSSGPHGSSRKFLAAGIPALLADHKIDLLISGHDHIYERGDVGGMRYLISGGGGAPLYREVKRLPATKQLEATYHYVEVAVTESEVRLVAKRADGSVLDRASFGKTPGWSGEPSKASLANPGLPGTPVEVPSPSSAPSSSSRCGCTTVGAPSSATGIGVAMAALMLSFSRLFRARRQTG